MKFIDISRFMSTSLSFLVSNLSEELHNHRCIDCKSCLDYMNENGKNRNLNKFILLLRKGPYPYKYIDSWERFNETSLPDKEAFYSNLNMEDITDIDFKHAKIVFKYLINKNLGDYHDLYVQSDRLLLPDFFENFRNMCINVYELDPAHFLSAPGLAWQACLKKTEVKLELLTNVDMLLKVEKGIRRGICHAMHRYAKANNKYMKDYNIHEEESFLDYLDANNLYGWAYQNHYLLMVLIGLRICLK